MAEHGCSRCNAVFSHRIDRDKHEATHDKAKFNLGMIVGTPGFLEACANAGEEPGTFIRRHARGDWGSLNEHDLQENENALKLGNRLLSAYTLKDGTKVWIITERDRSVTTMLLPDEY